MCVCVREREREREDSQKENLYRSAEDLGIPYFITLQTDTRDTYNLSTPIGIATKCLQLMM